MLSAGLAAAALSVSFQTAIAGERPAYDKRIEEAAIERVQTKLGEIRGPLGLHTSGNFDPSKPSEPTDPWVWLEFTPSNDKISG
jgi:hypothetical protein